MGGASSTHGGDEKWVKKFVGKSEGNRPLGISKWGGRIL
jgi:hypothetical protein